MSQLAVAAGVPVLGMLHPSLAAANSPPPPPSPFVDMFLPLLPASWLCVWMLICDVDTHITPSRRRCVAGVNYRCMPLHTFDEVLQDAALAFHHLSEELRYPAKDIAIAGDAAGAHLAISLVLNRKERSLEVSLGGLPARHCRAA